MVKIESAQKQVLEGEFFRMLSWFCHKIVSEVKFFRMLPGFCQKKVSEVDSLDVEKEVSLSSSSSGGSFYLNPITFGKELEFVQDVGEGGFSYVSKGMRRGLPVALKVAKPHTGSGENLFLYETALYMTPFFQHDNILRHICSDEVTIFGVQKYIMALEYHENGSLCQYLMNNQISRETLLKMTLSVSLGLEHLHEAFRSSYGCKPSVAHRDLKCTNVLVKKNWECCIADFGSSVVDSINHNDMHSIDLQVGTARYMAPEVLNKKLNPIEFKEFLKADIYSLSMLLWEVANSYASGKFNYAFHDLASDRPTIQEMREVAGKQGLRPPIDTEEWKKDIILQEFGKIIPELWSSDPAVRNAALDVRKRIQKMQQMSPGAILTSEEISPEGNSSETFFSKFWKGQEPLSSV